MQFLSTDLDPTRIFKKTIATAMWIAIYLTPLISGLHTIWKAEILEVRRN